MDIGSVRKSVEEGNRKLGAALERRNYADVAALYTENAKVLAPDVAMVTGKGAIEKFWRGGSQRERDCRCHAENPRSRGGR